MQIETLDSRELSPNDALAIGRLIYKVWPKAEKDAAFRQQQLLSMGRDYRGPENQAPRSYVIRNGDRVLAHATFVPRTIGTTRGELRIAGLCRVCCDPDMRGHGLGEMVVRPIFDLVDDAVFTFSIFQTSPKASKFYERLGACRANNSFVNSLGAHPQENPFWDEVIMGYPQDRDWPTGEIDLRGPGY